MDANEFLLLLAALGVRLEDVERSVAGVRAAEGPRGPKGDPGPPGPAPKHEWDDTRLRFQRPDGKWGEWVDLQGPAGASRGGGGGSRFDLESLPLALDDDPEMFVVRQAGVWRRATYAQMQSWLGGSPAVPEAVTVNGDPVTVGGSLVTVTA